jgi:hypothetical protein
MESCDSNRSFDYGVTAPTRNMGGWCAAYNFTCPSSYNAKGVGTSTPTCYRPPESRPRSETCPHGYYKSTLHTCEKDSYNIGIGTTPDVNGNCSGGVREYVEGSCYNPCQPLSNKYIQCAPGTENRGGYCQRAVCPYTSENVNGVCVRY